MLRKLLVSTALAGVLATGAYAQDANQTETQTPAATDTQSQTGAMETQSGDQQASADMQGEFLQNLSSDQYLASNLTGQSIYASDAQDAESVATIDNWLVDSDGRCRHRQHVPDRSGAYGRRSFRSDFLVDE